MARFKCNLCGFETDDAVVFASHILSAHSEVGETKAVAEPKTKPKQVYFECELCDAKFLTPEELEKHYYEKHPKEMKEIEKELRKQGIIPEGEEREREEEGKEEGKGLEHDKQDSSKSKRTKKASAKKAK